MEISSKTKIAGVVGDPISHSLSPKLHSYWLDKYQIDGKYEAWKVSADDLQSFLQDQLNKGFKGCNVTIPHKESAYKICDNLSDEAKLIGAVNTIIVTKDKKLYGHNSDGEGFVNNIKNHQPNFVFKNKTIVVLGSGGAARAICFALLKEQVSQIILTNRNFDRAENLAADFKKIPQFENCKIAVAAWEKRSEILFDCDLLINTTSLGMQGQDELAINLSALKKSALVSDIVYKPLVTKLLIDAEKNGNKIVTGIGMLINQAIVGFEAWYGIKPAVDKELTEQMISWSKQS